MHVYRCPLGKLDMWCVSRTVAQKGILCNLSHKKKKKIPTINVNLMKLDLLEAESGTGRWCCWEGCSVVIFQWWSQPRWPGSLWFADLEPPWTHATGSCQLCFPHWWRTRLSGSQASPKPLEALELFGERWTQSAWCEELDEQIDISAARALLSVTQWLPGVSTNYLTSSQWQQHAKWEIKCQLVSFRAAASKIRSLFPTNSWQESEPTYFPNVLLITIIIIRKA